MIYAELVIQQCAFFLFSVFPLPCHSFRAKHRQSPGDKNGKANVSCYPGCNASSYKLAFYAIMFNNGEKKTGRRSVLSFVFIFRAIKRAAPGVASRKIRFANRSRTRKNCCRVRTKKRRRTKATRVFRRQSTITIMLETR